MLETRVRKCISWARPLLGLWSNSQNLRELIIFSTFLIETEYFDHILLKRHFSNLRNFIFYHYLVKDDFSNSRDCILLFYNNFENEATNSTFGLTQYCYILFYMQRKLPLRQFNFYCNTDSMRVKIAKKRFYHEFILMLRWRENDTLGKKETYQAVRWGWWEGYKDSLYFILILCNQMHVLFCEILKYKSQGIVN